LESYNTITHAPVETEVETATHGRPFIPTINYILKSQEPNQKGILARKVQFMPIYNKQINLVIRSIRKGI